MDGFQNNLAHLFALILTTQSQLLTTLRKKFFENIVEKRENADNQHFLLLLQCFLPYQEQKFIILTTFNLSSANALNLVLSKELLFGKELMSRCAI